MQTRMTKEAQKTLKKFGDIFSKNSNGIEILGQAVANGSQENADAALKSAEELFKNTQLTVLGGANNKVFTMTRKGSTVIVSRSMISPESDAALAALNKDPSLPAHRHLAADYLTAPIKGLSQYTLKVTEYCAGGGLEKVVTSTDFSPKKRRENAINIAENAIQLMLDFKASGIFFPDIKTANFLLNSDHHLVVADKKSFLPTDEQSLKTLGLLTDQNHLIPIAIQDTITWLAPERYKNGFQHTRGFADLEKENSYKIGLILYELVTGQMVAPSKDSDLVKAIPREKDSLAQFKDKSDQVIGGLLKLDFDHPAFKTKDGKLSKSGNALLKVIKGLTTEDPKNRMSFEQAREIIAEYKQKNALTAATAMQPAKLTTEEKRQGLLKRLSSKFIQAANIGASPEGDSSPSASKPRAAMQRSVSTANIGKRGVIVREKSKPVQPVSSASLADMKQKIAHEKKGKPSSPDPEPEKSTRLSNK